MKKSAITCALTIALAAGAFAQGAIYLDNTTSGGAATVDDALTLYSGPVTIEVWELNTSAVPAGVNLPPAPGYGALAHNALVAAGFTLEATRWQTITAVSAGSFFLGEVEMANVSPKGGSVVIALAAWNSTAADWNTMLTTATGNTRAGVLGFVNPTADYQAPAVPPPFLIGWDPSTSLVMMPLGAPPAILSQPANEMVLVGQNATFSVAAQGTAPLTYQWRFNGTNYVGANTNSYTLPNAQPADAGNYDVVVTNAYGSATSAIGTLTVVGAAAIDIGLRMFDGTGVVSIACEAPGAGGQLTSPLRSAKNGTNYGIFLVATNAPNASRIRIQTSSGVKAWQKLP